MHSFSKLGFILGGILSSQAFAATFTVPDHFEMMYIDRERTSIFGGEEFEIKAGTHELILRYNQEIMHFKEEYNFRSEPIIVDLNIRQEDQLKLTAFLPEGIKQAEVYEKDPEFKIVDQQNKGVNYQAQALPFKSGFQLGRNYLNEVIALKEKQNSEVLKVSSEAKVTSVNAASVADLAVLKEWYRTADSNTQKAYRLWTIDPSATVKQETKALKMLKQRHLEASDNTRKALQIWIIEQL